MMDQKHGISESLHDSVVRFTLRLSPELNDKLTVEASKNQRSKNSMIVTILQIYFSTQELSRVKQDERWEAIKND